MGQPAEEERAKVTPTGEGAARAPSPQRRIRGNGLLHSEGACGSVGLVQGVVNGARRQRTFKCVESAIVLGAVRFRDPESKFDLRLSSVQIGVLQSATSKNKNATKLSSCECSKSLAT